MSTGTNPLSLKRPLLNPLAHSPDNNDEDGGFDLLEGLLDDANEEEEQECNIPKQPLLTQKPLQKSSKLIATTKPRPPPGDATNKPTAAAPAVGLRKDTNPFSRKSTVNTSGLARQPLPISNNVDSSAMLQSVLGPAMAFKRPAVVQHKPAKSNTDSAAAAGGLKKKENQKDDGKKEEEEEDDDDDFVKPVAKKPLISRQVPLIKKPPAPGSLLLRQKEEERTKSQLPQQPQQPPPLAQQQQNNSNFSTLPLETNPDILLPNSNSGSIAAGSGGGGASQRFQAPRMVPPQPPPLPQPLPPPQQQQQQQQQTRLDTDIIDLSKDEPSLDIPNEQGIHRPESPSAAVWLPDPYLEQPQQQQQQSERYPQQQQHQQQEVYRQADGFKEDPQHQPQIWRAPPDNGNTGALGGIFAQPQPYPQQQQQRQQQQLHQQQRQQQPLGGIFAPGPSSIAFNEYQQQQQQQEEGNHYQRSSRDHDEWSIPAAYTNTNNTSSYQYQREEQQRQEHDPYRQPAAAVRANHHHDAVIGGGGPAAGNSNRSWWYRLPDLVPVTVLQHGRNPRDGSVVHIDYKNQFSGKSSGGATSAAKKAARAAGAGTKSRVTKANIGGNSNTSAKGHWLTISGIKTYVDANGKSLTGAAAWKASEKESGRGSTGSGGTGRKKKTSRKTTAGGARKRATKKSSRR